jgi:hypothetical protein
MTSLYASKKLLSIKYISPFYIYKMYLIAMKEFWNIVIWDYLTVC